VGQPERGVLLDVGDRDPELAAVTDRVPDLLLGVPEAARASIP
jgi:hypothetical protein